MATTAARFLEFVKIDTGEVGRRINVTDLSEHLVEKCMRGMLINISPEWYVRDTADDPPST